MYQETAWLGGKVLMWLTVKKNNLYKKKKKKKGTGKQIHVDKQEEDKGIDCAPMKGKRLRSP